MALTVDGKEIVSFRVDEDCDCWRWRTFEDITIQTGAVIALTGMSDERDLAMLDYIEFITPKNWKHKTE